MVSRENGRPIPNPEGEPEEDTTQSTPPPRRPRSERPDAFNFVAWLMEGLAGLDSELRHNDLGLSEEFWRHTYAARREALLAARAALDTALERCALEEEETEQETKPAQKRGRIDIDF